MVIGIAVHSLMCGCSYPVGDELVFLRIPHITPQGELYGNSRRITAAAFYLILVLSYARINENTSFPVMLPEADMPPS